MHTITTHITCTNFSLPLNEPPDTAGDLMAASNFPHEAVVSSLNHSENIALQQFFTLCGLSSLIALNLASVRPSSIPISLQSEEYCGVTCRWSSFIVGTVDTGDNKISYKFH